LRERQKVKRIYGLSEKQFRNTFDRVRKLRGVTGENLFIALELRLDNVAYRMGLAPSRAAARQLIRHRHVEVSGKQVDIPSYRVNKSDEIRIRERSKNLTSVRASLEGLSRATPVSWISVDSERGSAKVTEMPTRDTIPIAAQEQLIVELYSK